MHHRKYCKVNRKYDWYSIETNRGIGAAKAAYATLSTSIESEERKNMNIKAITHGFMLLIVHLKELNIRIHLCKLTYLSWYKKQKTIRTTVTKFANYEQFIYELVNLGVKNSTLGWRALHPPQPGEKKSTITSLSPAFKSESTRSCAEVTSLMLGWWPFSHHFWILPTLSVICKIFTSGTTSIRKFQKNLKNKIKYNTFLKKIQNWN